MRLLIASDIHGDAQCCKRMLSCASLEKADKILLLGDILYHGPRNDIPTGYAPKEVIRMLNETKDKLICVRGNCDAEVDQMVLNFPIMSDTAIVYTGKHELVLSHGHIYNPDNLPAMSAQAIFLYGHTHVYKGEVSHGILCINPGSVSLPKQNNPQTFALYDGESIVIKTFDGEEILKKCI